MNTQLLGAGSLLLLATAVHGLGGELLVVRKLSLDALSTSPFGGPRTTKAMIHATWHLTTIGFFAVGIALLLAGSVLGGDEARGVKLIAASTCTGFAAVVIGLGAADTRSPKRLLHHPAPLLLSVAAALAWWGAV